MGTECIFCKIARKEIPAECVYESELIIAFHDIRPQAPFHILIIPRKHIATIDDIEVEDKLLIGDLFIVAKEIARELGLHASGYRLVFNCGRNAGQEVYHIHLHLLGGRKLLWPPG
ncbi:histidine triad nucleotide-binding protein [candidate division KSB1 bacterium]|nr:histidine triad nucleotide-binding protein [candidate division KSB1 bacterium]